MLREVAISDVRADARRELLLAVTGDEDPAEVDSVPRLGHAFFFVCRAME